MMTPAARPGLGTPVLRILLIDDHPLVRDGLRARLSAVPEFLVVGEAGTAAEALALAHDAEPDLALIDVSMPDGSGIGLAARFHDAFPDIAVLMLSMHDNTEYVRQAIGAGARGYLLKDTPAAEIIQAIRAVSAGQAYFSAAIAARLYQTLHQEEPLALLTRRERDILQRIGEGLANKQIAQALGLSVRTVETHRLNLKRKLGIEGHAELIRFAVAQQHPGS